MARKDEQGFFFNTTYAYDNAGRVTHIDHYRNGDATPFTQYVYQYDKADRISFLGTVHDTSIAAFPAGTEIQYLNYDKAGQLIDSDILGGADETFAYDENGNRIAPSANGTDIGDYNQLKFDADWNYTYDKEGNLIRKDAKVGSAYFIYEYDHRNRLTAVTRWASTTLYAGRREYRYNTDDQLVTKFNDLFSTTDHYIYDGSDRVLEFDNDDNIEHRYVHGPLTDQMLFDEVFDHLGQQNGVFAPAADHLQTTRAILDESGDIIQTIDYDAFGKINDLRDSQGQQLQNSGVILTALLATDVAFAGRYWDGDADLYYNYARWYDPHTSRFLSEDPIQEGSNWYRYAGNDPINFSDPTGLSQAGNPLNALAGGFGGNVVRQENLNLRNLNSSLLASPTLNYNSLNSPYGSGPVRSTSNTLAGLGNIAKTAAISTIKAFNPIASTVISTGLGLGASSLFGPVSYEPGKQYSAGRVSNSGKTFILDQPISSAQGKPFSNIPIAGGSVDLKAVSSGEVEIAVTGLKGDFDRLQAAKAYSSKYGSAPELGASAGQLFHHGPQTGTAVINGVELPVARMQLVPSGVNALIPHEGTAAVARRSIASQGVSATTVRTAATSYNASVIESLATKGSARAFAGLNVYMIGRDVLQAGGVLQPRYQPTGYSTYIYQDGGGSYTVQPAGWFSSATKTYVAGPQSGQVNKINSLTVNIHRSIAEQKYGRYVPGNIFTAPKFIHGSERQQIEYTDSRGFTAGYINETGVHRYDAGQVQRRTVF